MIFEMPISGGSAKRQRQRHLFLVPISCYFFPKKYFFSTEDSRVWLQPYDAELFILFTDTDH
jgi:hypothetical protein